MSRPMPTKSDLKSLYRSYLRQAARLPHIYLRQFYRLRLRIEMRRLLGVQHNSPPKFKRVQRELQKLEKANIGDVRAFSHVLDIAYGRKGPVKHFILNSILKNAPMPTHRVIKASPKSYLPVYSPEISALLMSPHTRISGKPITPQQMDTPPTLPTRANPDSLDAKLFGPLSKRREVNLKWRYFRSNWNKIYPPLELSRISESEVDNTVRSPGDIGLQGMGILEEVKELAGPIHTPPPTPRRQLRQTNLTSNSAVHSSVQTSNASAVLPTRFLRRRYRELLGRLPILQYVPLQGNKDSAVVASDFRVSLADASISPKLYNASACSVDADETDMFWYEGTGVAICSSKRKCSR